MMRYLLKNINLHPLLVNHLPIIGMTALLDEDEDEKEDSTSVFLLKRGVIK